MRHNVSAVVRERGFVRIACYKWAHQAGIFTGKSAEPQREEYCSCASPVSRAQPRAARVCVDKRSAQDWDRESASSTAVVSIRTAGSCGIGKIRYWPV